jgi:hypothetical protein
VTKISQYVYFASASLFLLGVAIQVFFAGMVVVALEWGWGNHRDLGHSLALPLLVMLLTAYLGRLPRRMKWLTWLLFMVYFIQADVIIFMRATLPVVSAFHPVLALVDFALAIFLVYQAWMLVRVIRKKRTVSPNFEQFDKIGLQ